jgi:hypothetical protein
VRIFLVPNGYEAGWAGHPTCRVKLSLCLTKHHTMKAYWGSGGIMPHIL